MEKLAENDLTYFYLHHVVIVVTAVTMISLTPVIHAAHTIKGKVDNNTQVVFLTDALSVLQALMNDNLPQLEQALYTIKTLRTVLQWIPSHCGVHGNKQADGLVKHGAGQQHKKTQYASQR